MQIFMIQNEIIQPENVPQACFDRGIYFGDGVYEVLRSYNGRIFALDSHMKRLANSLAAIGIAGVDIELIRGRVLKAFAASEIADAKIYFHITRGCGMRNHTWDNNLEPRFFLTVTELDDDSRIKANGVAVATHPDWRWKRCDIKSLNLLANVLARQSAAEKGCYEAILVDEHGFITEGAASAFFAIFGQKLHTAPLKANILPSITREFVLKAGKDIGMRIVEESLTAERAADADELFIGVTTKDVVPVVRFDAKTIGDGRVGSYTKLLAEQFLTFTR